MSCEIGPFLKSPKSTNLGHANIFIANPSKEETKIGKHLLPQQMSSFKHKFWLKLLYNYLKKQLLKWVINLNLQKI